MNPKYDLAFRLTDPDDWYLVKFNNHTVFEGPLDDCMTFIKFRSKKAYLNCKNIYSPEFPF